VLSAHGLPPLPHTTPHTLRRTYISIALLANRFDVLWGMSQVGHADSNMTMDVYAQLQQRAQREHGRAFDALIRQARERLNGHVDTPIRRFWAPHRASASNLACQRSPTRPAAACSQTRARVRTGRCAEDELAAISRGSGSTKVSTNGQSSAMARPGLEPGTPRFSVVCSTN